MKLPFTINESCSEENDGIMEGWKSVLLAVTIASLFPLHETANWN
jgi:hypothetical protein